MTCVWRSWWPDGSDLLSCRLRCDSCGRLSAPNEIGQAWSLEADLVHLSFRCRRRGWRRRTLVGADGLFRADYCRACVMARRDT